MKIKLLSYGFSPRSLNYYATASTPITLIQHNVFGCLKLLSCEILYVSHIYNFGIRRNAMSQMG